jgi:glutamate dehydrogenase/leucine dehydrogenase
VDELIKNARTMSLKYGFLGLSIGGAKAGVILKTEEREYRRELFRIFGERLSTIIKNRIYLPGIDLGTTLDDLRDIEKGAGVNLHLKNWQDVSHVYTSWSIYASAKAAIDIISLKENDMKVAIDGFGKVGSEVAKIFSKTAIVVAVSNRHSAIYNEKGLDVPFLLQLRDRYNEDFIFRYPNASIIKKSELFYMPVDILIPCGRSFDVNMLEIDRIKAKIICPGTNEPFTEELENHLFERGGICFPDFVCNSGGVLGSLMRHYMKDSQIARFIQSEYREKVSSLLVKALKTNVSVGKLSREIVYKRIELMRGTNEKRLLNIKGIIPEFFKRPFARVYFSKRLKCTL